MFAYFSPTLFPKVHDVSMAGQKAACWLTRLDQRSLDFGVFTDCLKRLTDPSRYEILLHPSRVERVNWQIAVMDTWCKWSRWEMEIAGPSIILAEADLVWWVFRSYISTWIAVACDTEPISCTLASIFLPSKAQRRRPNSAHQSRETFNKDTIRSRLTRMEMTRWY